MAFLQKASWSVPGALGGAHGPNSEKLELMEA